MPYIFSTDHFSCQLETRPCEWEAGCKRKVTIGLSLCWQHSRIKYGVAVAPSRIADAGKGLFAVRDFAKGEFICPYGGRLLTQAQLDRLYPEDALAPYVEDLHNGYYRDAACVRGIGSLGNGSSRKADSNAEAYLRTARTPWLRALKRIDEGDEIIIHYGRQYFAEDIHTSVTRYRRPRLTE